MLGYCVKCREKREFNPTESKSIKTTRGEKYMKQGKCSDCGTKISVMVRKGD